MSLHQEQTKTEASRVVQLANNTPSPEGPLMPHRQPAEAVVAGLGSDTARGLSRDEARRRLESYGPNQLKSAPETPWWRRLLEQFQNFLVIILLLPCSKWCR